MIKIKTFMFAPVLLCLLMACSQLPFQQKSADNKNATASTPNTQVGSANNKSRHNTDNNRPTEPGRSGASNAEEAPEQPARLFYIRASVAASAVPAEIYMLDKGRPKFIAASKNNTRVQQSLSPGRYVFMLVAGESIDYLEVNVSSGNDYYCLVKPSMGVWRPSFTLLPIKKRRGDERETSAISLDRREAHFYGDEYVNTILGLSMPVVYGKNSEISLWADEALHELHLEHWADWQLLPEEEKASKSLGIDDGR